MDELCTCGHPRSDHYEYILNGKPAIRCKACDPMARQGGGNYAMEAGTYVEAMYKAADHDFAPATVPAWKAPEYLAYGPGFSCECDTWLDAQTVCEVNGGGAVFWLMFCHG